MSGLREWAAASKQAGAAARKHHAKHACDPAVQGGQPAEPPVTASSSSNYATLYCTGHSDGVVRLWDMHGQVPTLLGAAPSRAAAEALGSMRRRTAAVSTLEMAWEQGLLITGHEGGEVRDLGSAVDFAAMPFGFVGVPLPLPAESR